VKAFPVEWLQQIVDRVQLESAGGGIEQLATDLFLESVRFGLAWVEDPKLAPTWYHNRPPC
jgi:hypothetical protein